MTSINSNFFKDVKSFVSNHKVLCASTLGLAVAVYSLGNLVGRIVTWIVKCCGTTQKVDIIGCKKIHSFSNISAGSTKPIGSVFSSKVNDARKSFAAFTVELEKEIFPFYEKHETGFDKSRIHGRMHVARATLFGEVMARYYHDKGESVDFDFVRRTIGMHDAGREENGIDLWEKESSELLCNHLKMKNTPHEIALQKSKIIIKEEADKNSIDFKIFQSADCLDIMRPCTGNGGRKGFNPNFLTFLKNAKSDESKFRKDLIEEAWFFIQITEAKKMTEFNESEGFMNKLFQILKENQSKLPILSSIL